MIKDFDIKWFVEIINNIIILDEQKSIVYIGDIVKNKLFDSDNNIEKKFLKNFQSKEKKEIKKVLDGVIKHKGTGKVELDKLKQPIYIFSTSQNGTNNLIVSIDDTILKKSQVEYDLRERVKELECLYNISYELKANNNLNDALEKCLSHIIKGFQFPDATFVRIKVDDIDLSKPKCSDAKNTLKQSIKVKGKKRGEIEVSCCIDEPFLKEEEKLLDEISNLLGVSIEKKDLTNQLEKNISKLKYLVEWCRNSRNKLETLFNAITDTIIVIDKNFEIIMSNKKHIGNEGKCYNKMFGIEERCSKCPAKIAFEEGKTVKFEHERESEDKYFSLQAYPIFNNKGKVERVLEICKDITKEKHMEAQLLQTDKLASIGKLVSGIAHEINNPNTFIKGNINIIKESFDDILPILDSVSKNRDNFKIARLPYEVFRENIPVLVSDMSKGTKRIKKIVDALRNFSRRDEGYLDDTVNINEIVKNSLRLLQNQISRTAKIDLKLKKNVPEFKGNIQKLEQMLINLIINSNEAIEGKKGKIIIKTDFDSNNNNILLSVKDNGEGIDAKTKKNIFDPFFTTKRNKGGTGLGLSIAYGIIKEHNAEVEVESLKGKGTEFLIRIPKNVPTKE